MAEETKQTEEVVEEVEQEEVDTQESAEQQPEEEMVPKAQMEKIIQNRVAREKKNAEKQVEEAKRLAKMNEEEKREFEYEKLQEELAELKRKDAYYGLSKEASKMLSEHNIQANDEVLQLVVKDDAEATKESVSAFVELVNEKVEQGVQKALSGRTPKANVNANQAVTKESIMEIKDATERIKAIQANPQLFK